MNDPFHVGPAFSRSSFVLLVGEVCNFIRFLVCLVWMVEFVGFGLLVCCCLRLGLLRLLVCWFVGLFIGVCV